MASQQKEKMPVKFDFLDFQDSLQPYLDLLSVSCTALAYKANEHDDNGLNLIAHAIEAQISQIDELCKKYHSLYNK